MSCMCYVLGLFLLNIVMSIMFACIIIIIFTMANAVGPVKARVLYFITQIKMRSKVRMCALAKAPMCFLFILFNCIQNMLTYIN